MFVFFSFLSFHSYNRHFVTIPSLICADYLLNCCQQTGDYLRNMQGLKHVCLTYGKPIQLGFACFIFKHMQIPRASSLLLTFLKSCSTTLTHVIMEGLCTEFLITLRLKNLKGLCITEKQEGIKLPEWYVLL